VITIEGNGMIQIIIVNKHLDNNTTHPKVLLCYDLIKGITNEEEKILCMIEPNLFTIQTITLLKSEILNVGIFGAKINTKDLTFNFPHSEGWI
jgi:hypothetical protein